jgi:hypothetical protein
MARGINATKAKYFAGNSLRFHKTHSVQVPANGRSENNAGEFLHHFDAGILFCKTHPSPHHNWRDKAHQTKQYASAGSVHQR